MYLSADKEKDAVLAEGGKIRIAWDDKYFYLACEFTDSDVVAEGDKDQLHHYQLGDLCELFLKPADKSWYWEIYMTPRNNKSVFFFPSKGYLGLPSCFEVCHVFLNYFVCCLFFVLLSEIILFSGYIFSLIYLFRVAAQQKAAALLFWESCPP